MAKSRASAQQPQLLKQHIPQMPEGYYSSGPNPNLRRFVEEHATPYDRATDHYNIPPFDQPITTTKVSAIYNMHSYHQGKKPHDAIRQYIRHYTRPGELVLDPFCGSGSTALAALMDGRAAIAIDLSPAATFITKNYCTPVDGHHLERAFAALEHRVRPEMDWLYETRCDRCDGRASTDFVVFSHTFQCSRCLEKIPLFDSVVVDGRIVGTKAQKVKVCPLCYARGHAEELNTHGERFEAVPVLVAYYCEEGCTPASAERRHDDLDPKKRSYFEHYDLGKLLEIAETEIPHRYPQDRMMNCESETEPWGDKWRAGTSNFRRAFDLFTRRNLWALAGYYEAVRSLTGEAERDSLLFALNAILLAMSRMQGYVEDPRFPNQLMRGTYYLPPIGREYNVSKWLGGKVRNLVAGYKSILLNGLSTGLLVSTQSATDLSGIPSESVDYVFTDPPYSDNVQYGELNFVWEAWLGLDTSWHDREIIVNRTRDRTEGDWARMMRQALRECFRALKPGRWLSLCYHDASEGTWQLTQDLMTEVGFIPESSDAALYIETGQKSFNQLMAEKVTKRDLVINFRKPRPGEFGQLALSGDEDPATFAQKARAILTEALQTHPGSPADRLYDELVSRMVRKGQFERHNFDALLRSVAEDPRADNHWYLLETADEADVGESAREAAAADYLAGFIARRVAENPEESGIHYSDLFEQYLPVRDKPRRLLQDWLPEFFFKTPEGTWRLPVGDEERAQKEALRNSGTLRRTKRFVRALLEGVPPVDRDRPPNIATAADWLRQCRRAGLYELGRALYEKGGFRFEDLGEAARLEVEEDYQTCVRRS